MDFFHNRQHAAFWRGRGLRRIPAAFEGKMHVPKTRNGVLVVPYRNQRSPKAAFLPFSFLEQCTRAWEMQSMYNTRDRYRHFTDAVMTLANDKTHEKITSDNDK